MPNYRDVTFTLGINTILAFAQLSNFRPLLTYVNTRGTNGTISILPL